MNGKAIKVSFLHPRDSRAFDAEIGSGTTGEKALAELAKAGFIAPAGGGKAYVLQHEKTGKSIPPSQALVAAGVEDGDKVAVTETSAGAGA